MPEESDSEESAASDSQGRILDRRVRAALAESVDEWEIMPWLSTHREILLGIRKRRNRPFKLLGVAAVLLVVLSVLLVIARFDGNGLGVSGSQSATPSGPSSSSSGSSTGAGSGNSTSSGSSTGSGSGSSSDNSTSSGANSSAAPCPKVRAGTQTTSSCATSISTSTSGTAVSGNSTTTIANGSGGNTGQPQVSGVLATTVGRTVTVYLPGVSGLIWSTPKVTQVLSGSTQVLRAGRATFNSSNNAVTVPFTGQLPGSVVVSASATPLCAGQKTKTCGPAVWQWSVIVNVGG